MRMVTVEAYGHPVTPRPWGRKKPLVAAEPT